MKSRNLAVAAVAALAVAAVPATASAATQDVTAAVTSVLSVTPVAAAMGTVTPGSSTAATATGNVVVISNSCYNATIYGTHLSQVVGTTTNTFSSALNWKIGSGSYAALPDSSAPAGIWTASQPITALTGDTFAMGYQQPLSSENVPSGAYTATATITASAATC